MNRKLLFPSERKSVKKSFAYLFDFEFQKGWFSSTAKHRFWDSLKYYVFDYLFDGTPHLYDDDYGSVGVCLYNKEEAEIMYDYLDFFKEHFDGEMPDDYYVNHPKWLEFTKRAQEIVKMMEVNEEKYNFKEDLEDYYEEFSRKQRKEIETETITIIEETTSFSLEEKEKLKRKILANCSDEQFWETASSITKEIRSLE